VPPPLEARHARDRRNHRDFDHTGQRQLAPFGRSRQTVGKHSFCQERWNRRAPCTVGCIPCGSLYH